MVSEYETTFFHSNPPNNHLNRIFTKCGYILKKTRDQYFVYNEYHNYRTDHDSDSSYIGYMKVSDSKVYYMPEELYNDINIYISVLDLNRLVHAFNSDNEIEYLSHGMSVVKNKFGGGKKIITGDTKSGIEFMPVSCYVMCCIDRVGPGPEEQSAVTIKRYWRKYRLVCKLREASYIYRLTCNFMNKTSFF